MGCKPGSARSRFPEPGAGSLSRMDWTRRNSANPAQSPPGRPSARRLLARSSASTGLLWHGPAHPSQWMAAWRDSILLEAGALVGAEGPEGPGSGGRTGRRGSEEAGPDPLVPPCGLLVVQWAPMATPTARHRPLPVDDDGRLRRGRPERAAPPSSSTCARCPTTATTSSPPASSRRSSTSRASASPIEQLRLPAASCRSSPASRPRFFDVDAARPALHGRRVGDAGGHAVLRVRAGPARDGAACSQAQLVETALLATINFQTLIASKAARIVVVGRRPARARVRVAPRPRHRGGGAGRARGAPRRLRRRPPTSRPAAASASPSRARWRTRG